MKYSKCVVLALMVLGIVAGAATSADAQDRFPYSVASGDPRPDSVILWTKVQDPDMPDAVQVEVATDENFSDIVFTRSLTAEAAYDYVVKLRVEGLMPYTTYYYRFIYGSGALMEYSNVGRTRTAPDPTDPKPVRFAVVYCQDYVGRYYNVFAKMLKDHDEDIDFVVHLGDYIYETTGDPSFQNSSSDREIVFSDEAGAIALGDGTEPYFGASSLSNYREIYATYRTDEVFQQVHERWPMITIWDDHEFSDDSWGATATYFDGRKDEYDEDRKRNSEQAFFEWAPIDVGINADGVFELDASMLYPNSKIYRDFHFGSLLHLVMTDYRNYRPDHIVPEDAFPGTIVLDRATLEGAMGTEMYEAMAENFDPYINLDAFASLPIFRQTLVMIAAQAYLMENPELGFVGAVREAESHLHGNISATIINALFASAGLPQPLPESFLAMLPRGISYLYVGKQSMYGSTGSRYLVMNDSYNLLAAILAQATAGAAQDAYGGQQMAWLQGVVTQSPATWTLLGSSTSMAPMVIDFTNPLLAAMLPPEFPDQLRTRLKLNVDQWDGFPEMRAGLLDMLKVPENGVVISGDIHATFVTDHGDGVFEFTGPAVSSGTFGSMVANVVASNPLLGNIEGIEQLIDFLPSLLQLSASDDVMVSTSDIAYANTSSHGFMIMDATNIALNVTLMEVPEAESFVNHYEEPEVLDAIFTESGWRVQHGLLQPTK